MPDLVFSGFRIWFSQDSGSGFFGFGFFGFKGSDRLRASTIQRCQALSPSHNLFGGLSKTFDFWVVSADIRSYREGGLT
jgi:hypothetical protein